MNKFNKVKFIPKKKKNTKVANKKKMKTDSNNQENREVKTKYIYTGTHGSSYLIMPDGSKENYNNIVDKYHDVIEI